MAGARWRTGIPGYTVDPSHLGSPNAYRVWKGERRYWPERTFGDDTDLGFIVYVSDKKGWGVACRVAIGPDGKTRVPTENPQCPFGVVYHDNPADACAHLERETLKRRAARQASTAAD